MSLIKYQVSFPSSYTVGLTQLLMILRFIYDQKDII